MSSSQRITIFGRNHNVKGGVSLLSLESLPVTLGTSAGVTDKPNEDSAGVSVAGPGMVIAIADGHWGGGASEMAVSKAVDLLDQDFQTFRHDETQTKLSALFEQVNNQLYELAVSSPGAVTPETTLIVCHVRESEAGKRLCWASFGDSYLFLLRGDRIRMLNSLHPRWLGYISRLSEKAEPRAILMRSMVDKARYVGVSGGLETGIEELDSGDIVFLCTDGLIGSDQDPDPVVVARIRNLLMSDLPLHSRLEKIIASALERGEKDNITCLAALIS